MRAYLDAMDTAPFGPPSASDASRRVLSALDPDMLELARERALGAHQMGMPAEHTRRSRAVLGPDALVAVTQFVILEPAGSHTAELARTYAAAALPNRRSLLQHLGFHDVDALDGALVGALIARGVRRRHRPPRHSAHRGRRRPREPLRPHGRTRDPAHPTMAGTRHPAPGLTPPTCPGTLTTQPVRAIRGQVPGHIGHRSTEAGRTGPSSESRRHR
jgi:hypothetical protein